MNDSQAVTDPDEAVRQMNDILLRKASILYEMHSISEQACGYLSEDKLDTLDSIVASKQGLIYEVEYLDRQFMAAFTKTKSDFGLESIGDIRGVKAGLLANLRANTEEVFSLLQKMGQVEVRFNDGLKKLAEKTSAELTRIRKQKEISGLYAKSHAPAAN